MGMGSSQGTIYEPVEIPTRQPTTIQHEQCLLCLTRYQRERLSVCNCNHCSFPLCKDCLEDHIDDMPKNISELSDQCHELEQLLQSKKNMIQQEVSNSTLEIKEFVKRYQNDLVETLHTITRSLENSKQDAEGYLNIIDGKLQTIKVDIENLTREPLHQQERMDALLNQLNQMQEQLQAYDVSKETELQIVLPKYTLKFQYIPNTTTDTIESSEPESSNIQNNSRRKSNRQNQYHPYRKKSMNLNKKNSSSSTNGEIDPN